MDDTRVFPPITFHCPRQPTLDRDQRTVWCDDCGKPVHNLSAMSAAEQEALLARTPDACVSYRQQRRLIPVAVLVLAMVSAAATTLPDEPARTDTAEEPEQVLMGAVQAPAPEPEFRAEFRGRVAVPQSAPAPVEKPE